MGEAVQHRVVDRGAEHLAERHRAERRVVVDVAGLGAALADHLVRERVELEQVHADVGGRLRARVSTSATKRPGGLHLLDLGRGSQLDHAGSLRRVSVETWTEPRRSADAGAGVGRGAARPARRRAHGGGRAAARPAVVQRDPVRDHRRPGLVQGQRRRHASRGGPGPAARRLVPGLVPEVLAVDAERGWSLSRDAGPVLREARARRRAVGGVGGAAARATPRRRSCCPGTATRCSPPGSPRCRRRPPRTWPGCCWTSWRPRPRTRAG